MRRFPAPWTVEAIDGGFKVADANKQPLTHIYGHADPRYAGIANAQKNLRGWTTLVGSEGRSSSRHLPSPNPKGPFGGKWTAVGLIE